MKLFHHTAFLEEFCRRTKQYAMYVCHDCGDTISYEEIIKAAPYLAEEWQILADGSGYLVFDTEDAMNTYFNLTVGDDGPTKQNTYNGPARVYALTCGPSGTLNENT